MCGENDVLVAAIHLEVLGKAERLPADALDPHGVTYWHLMFEEHEIVFSDGVATESFRPGPEALKTMPEALREFRRMFPGFDQPQGVFPPVRYCAKPFEVRAMPDVLFHRDGDR